jgi:hypothetical protein
MTVHQSVGHKGPVYRHLDQKGLNPVFTLLHSPTRMFNPLKNRVRRKWQCEYIEEKERRCNLRGNTASVCQIPVDRTFVPPVKVIPDEFAVTLVLLILAVCTDCSFGGMKCRKLQCGWRACLYPVCRT